MWEIIALSLQSPLANFIYALGVAALFLAASSRFRKLEGVEPTRVANLLVFLGALRLLEAAVNATAAIGLRESLQLMAPLERTIHMITILGIGWLWAPHLIARSKILYLVLALLSILTLSISLVLIWGAQPVAFNYSVKDYLWSAACFLFSFAGLILLVISSHSSNLSTSWRSFVRWKTLGATLLLILSLGQTIHLFLAEPYGNMPLATEAATLISLVIIFRMAGKELFWPIMGSEGEEDAAQNADSGFEKPTKPLYGQLVKLAKETTISFSADACAFLSLPDDGEGAIIEGAYNLLRDSPILPTLIRKSHIATLVEVISAGDVRRTTSEIDSEDFSILETTLGVAVGANLLSAGIPGVSANTAWGVILLRAKAQWEFEDEINLQTQVNRFSYKLFNLLALAVN